MIRTTLATLVLLGVVSAASLKNRIQHPKNNLAETFTGTSHTCQTAINRVKAGPADYASIIKAGAAYTDASFPATSEMVTWSDYPGADSLSYYAGSSSYQRLSAKFSSPTVFGTTTTADDIEQN